MSNKQKLPGQRSLDNAWDAWTIRVVMEGANKRDVNHFPECGLPGAETRYNPDRNSPWADRTKSSPMQSRTTHSFTAFPFTLS
jgi:hypothetical protein